MSETTTALADSELRSEIKHALNRASAENASGTPDHVLADYLLACLSAFDAAIEARANWRGESVELPALSVDVPEGGDPS